MPRQKNKKEKFCIKCNVKLTSENWLDYLVKRSNYTCTSCFRSYGKNYYKKSKEALLLKTPKSRSKSNNKYITPNTKTQQERKKLIQKYRYLQIRNTVIAKYSDNTCKICGENDLEVLTIDHIHDNGANHRKIMKNKNIYEWLKSENYPDGYQVLCFNCNCTKNVYKKAKKGKDYGLINKEKAIYGYNQECQNCGENNIKKLTLDHVHNNGAEHRKKTGCGTGQVLYRWVIKNNFPPNVFQVLCFNCNCKKNSCRIKKGDIIIK